MVHVGVQALPVYPHRSAHPSDFHISSTYQLPQRGPRQTRQLLGLLVRNPFAGYLGLHQSPFFVARRFYLRVFSARCKLLATDNFYLSVTTRNDFPDEEKNVAQAK